MSNNTDEDSENKRDDGGSAIAALFRGGPVDLAIDEFRTPAPQEWFKGRGDFSSDPNHKWSGPSIGSLSGDAQHRIEQVVTAARNVYKDYPPAFRETMVQITTAQALQESGTHLDSGLARKNNFFGIKGSGTAGSEGFMTSEYGGGGSFRIRANFAVNATPEDSFLQHQEFLQHKRYHGVLEAAKEGDFAGAVRELQRAGYATDPAYAAQLISMNERIVKPLMERMGEGSTLVATGTPLQSTPSYGGDAANLPVWNSTVRLEKENVEFLKRVENVMDGMRKAGFDPIIGSGGRDMREQIEKVRMGYSHTVMGSHHLEVPGIGATAVDVIPRGYGWDHAPQGFYETMGKLAKEQGLEWGGDWRARFNGVPDVAHMQVPGRVGEPVHFKSPVPGPYNVVKQETAENVTLASANAGRDSLPNVKSPSLVPDQTNETAPKFGGGSTKPEDQDTWMGTSRKTASSGAKGATTVASPKFSPLMAPVGPTGS